MEKEMQKDLSFHYYDQMRQRVVAQAETIKTLNSQLKNEWLESTDLNLPIAFEDVEDGEWYWIESDGLYHGWAMANLYINEDGNEINEFMTIEGKLLFDDIQKDEGEVYNKRVYQYE